MPVIVTSNQQRRGAEHVLSRLLDTHLTRGLPIDAQDLRWRRRPDDLRDRRPR